MFNLGMGEALVIAVLCLVLFGAKRIPALGSSLGKAIVNFKKGLNSEETEDDENKKNLT